MVAVDEVSAQTTPSIVTVAVAALRFLPIRESITSADISVAGTNRVHHCGAVFFELDGTRECFGVEAVAIKDICGGGSAMVEGSLSRGRL